MANKDKNSNFPDENSHQSGVGLTNVLQLAVTTSSPDAAAASHNVPLSDHDKEFLSKTLDNLTTTHIKEIRKNLELLDKYLSSLSSQAEALQVLESLAEWLENPDFAIDFCKMEGMNYLEKLILMKEDNPVRLAAMNLFSIVVQNNQDCQNTVREETIHCLLDMLDDEVDDIRVKVVQSLSAFVRSNASGGEIFYKRNGFAKMVNILQEPTQSDKLKVKIMFFLHAACEEWNDTLISDLIAANLINILTETSQDDNNQVREYSLSIINSLLSKSLTAVGKLIDKEYINYLQRQANDLEGNDACLEEMEYINSIIEKVMIK